MSRANAIHRAHNQYAGTPEWYTPPWLLARVADFYGGGYFDPCPASGGVIRENGLMLSWAGQRVFCNPPYGRLIVPWIVKAMMEPVDELILLVPAYTDTKWFRPLFDYPICFMRGRVSFLKHGQKMEHAPHASVLVYRGPAKRLPAFVEAFADLGPITRTYAPCRVALPQPALFAEAV